MRRSTIPQRTVKPDVAMRAPEPPKRKIFNCIVDDTALVAGVKKSTRDGIRKWISQGAIRLYVPLHTLTQLHRLKSGNERINADAREAVKWLDEVTSMPDIDTANSVQLEGVEEEYNTWAEVEQYLLPETLLSMEDSASEDEYHEDLESSFNALDVSDETSVSSTHSYEDAPKTPESSKSGLSKDAQPSKLAKRDSKMVLLTVEPSDRTARNSVDMPCAEKSSQSIVPVYLQPLFNHTLWRINKESNPDAALESFLLLTNDPMKQAIAQKFGIRARRLEQLRDAVAREDREYKNHLTMHRIEVDATTTQQIPATDVPKVNERPKSSPAHEVKPLETSDDEDVVLFQRAPRGPAAITKNPRVFDPNDFGRTNPPQSSRGGRGGHTPPRGRGGPPFRGRGNFAPRGGAYVPPGPTFRTPPAPRHDPTQPIDPESFARPTPKPSPVRGGGRRKLWEPN
ncbi:hypothetical protein ACN47E_000449 [Coniothyrium glycines]